MSIAAVLHILHHLRDIRLRIRLLFPQIKIDIQAGVYLSEVCHRHIDNMLPQRKISFPAGLQLGCCRLCLLFIILMLLGISAGIWIDLLQICHGKRRFCRIFSLIALIKIYKLRLTML